MSGQGRIYRKRGRGVFLGVLLGGLGLTGEVAEARAVRAAFQAGEAFVYKFSVGTIEAGQARMSVGIPERHEGSRLVAIQADAHSLPWLGLLVRLDDTYQVILEADRLLPRRVVSNETGLRERSIRAELEGHRVKLRFTTPKEDQQYQRVLPGLARDPVAALFALRAAPLAEGERIDQLMLDGVALYRVSCTVVAREELRLGSEQDPAPPRTIRAIHIEAQAQRIDDLGRPTSQPPRRFRIWLSDDERRIPCRLTGDTDLGEGRLELMSYIPPGDAPAGVEGGAGSRVRQEPARSRTYDSSGGISP
ncbi:MAG TPA: DUF3108 domain-containing protein [Polyangia bacterium]|nr:DUF3108 domain-containing protein [Polyangia bacterium]